MAWGVRQPFWYAPPPYDRAALVRDVQALLGGADPSRRLVDWVELGLVPAPVRHGLGRGRGITSSWTLFGRNLWLDLSLNRKRGADVATLCSVPVALWVYREPSPIQIAQVRRALRTWATRRLSRRTGELARSAALTLGRVADPTAGKAARKRLTEALIDDLVNARMTEKELYPLVLAVVAPGPMGRLGTEHEQVAKLVAREFAAQARGARRLAVRISDLANEAELLEDLWEARTLVRQATLDQAADPKKALALALRLGVPEPALGAARGSFACLDVAEALGFLHTKNRRVASHGGG